MKEIALIVAAGSGTRIGGETPKQLRLLNGIPLSIYPGIQFRRYSPEIELNYVVAPNYLTIWEGILSKYFPHGAWKIVEGGASRYLSVRNGISAVSKTEESLVAIHDGARPFISPGIIANAFESARKHGSGVVMVPVKDSIRIKKDNKSQTVDRSNFFLVQTPQVFCLTDLIKAYSQPDQNIFTDDATVMEIQGIDIHLVPGSYDNFKVTTPEDLLLASMICQKYL